MRSARLALAGALCAQLLTVAFAAPEAGSAAVPKSHFAYGVFAELEKQKLPTGLPVGSYTGEGTLTPVEMGMAARKTLAFLKKRKDADPQLVSKLTQIDAEWKPEATPTPLAEYASPDGKRIVRILPRKGDETEVVLFDTSGKKPKTKKLVGGGYNYGGTWSADGRAFGWIQFTGDSTSVRLLSTEKNDSWRAEWVSDPRRAALKWETNSTLRVAIGGGGWTQVSLTPPAGANTGFGAVVP